MVVTFRDVEEHAMAHILVQVAKAKLKDVSITSEISDRQDPLNTTKLQNVTIRMSGLEYNMGVVLSDRDATLTIIELNTADVKLVCSIDRLDYSEIITN